MNSYSLGLGAPWYLFALSIAAGFALTFWIYRRTIPVVSPGRKLTLTLLRGFALSVLFFCLFDPVLTAVHGSMEKPKIVVLADNSLSMSFTDPTGLRSDLMKKAYDLSGLKNYDLEAIRFVSFSDAPRFYEKSGTDSMSFAGPETDISRAVRYAAGLTDKENVRAVVILTDGAYNSGRNPVTDAQTLGLPVYAVGIGDTIDPKDVSVQSVLTSEVAYIDNPIPVSASIKSSGYDSRPVKVTLSDNGKKIDERTVTLNASSGEVPVLFSYKPAQEGVRKLTVSVEHLDGEQTEKNNAYSEFVNVLKNKHNIAILAGSPSPDLSFVVNTFSDEKGIEIKKYIQKKEGEFYETPTKQALADADIIYLIGFPIASTPATVIDMIRAEAERGKSLFFVAARNTDYVKLRALEDYLPFNVLSTGNQEYKVLPDVKREALASPLVRITGTEKDLEYWNKLPPIFRTETYTRVKPESEVISTVKINNSPLKEPLILSRSLGNRQSIAVLGYGIYLWKLAGFASESSNFGDEAVDVFSLFMKNSYRKLSNNLNKKNVIIKTDKKQYVLGEYVEFTAKVADAAYVPVDNATVSVHVTSGGQSRDITLTSAGSGRYYAKVEGLGEGDYTFGGTAIANGNKIGSDDGRFTVGETALEFLNLKMNAPFLKTMASVTGGKFYTGQEVSSLIDDIKKHKGWHERPITSRTELEIGKYALMLALGILLLSIEWFLRKRYGML